MLKTRVFKTKNTNKIMEDSIEEKVKEIVAEQFGIDKTEIKLETSFIENLNADSLDRIELLMEFGEEYDLEIPDKDVGKLQTVGDAVDYIEDYTKRKSGESGNYKPK